MMWAQGQQASEEEVFDLSPFEVTTGENDVGYYASSTLAGTRMNSRIADLASSISVVTPQQLQDTASVDLNDVFLYEAGVEGTHTYTAYEIDRSGGVTQTAQQSPQDANRMRGLSAPERGVNYFISLRSIPVDAYNVERLTINRGPNSVLYGLGSPSGLVNVSTMRAYVNAEAKGEVSLRVGSFDDFRASFNYGTPIIEDKLAIRVAGVYHDKGFQQDPTEDTTRRYFVTGTYKPFEGTTIRASYENLNNEYQRATVVTPQDYVTPWREAGSPTFNPSTMMVSLNGQQIPLSSASVDAVLAASNNGLIPQANATRPTFLVDNGAYYSVNGNPQQPIRMQQRLAVKNIAESKMEVEQMLVSNTYEYESPLFISPGISDQSIYDWEEVNLLSGNLGEDDAEMYELTLEQQILDNLFVEVAARREDFSRRTSTSLNGRASSLFVDVNETLLDGTPNPYFLKPYVEIWEPDLNDRFEINDTIRGTVAYNIDFTKNEGWSKWLGRHNLMGLGQYRSIETESYRWREAITSYHDWISSPNSNKHGGGNVQKSFNRIFYVGNDAQVQYGTGPVFTFSSPATPGNEYPSGVIGQQYVSTVRHFAPMLDANNQLVRDGDPTYPVAGGRPMGEWVYENTMGGLLLHGANREELELESYAGALQSYFWKDRIITTMGWRHDTQTSRRSLSPVINDYGYRSGIDYALNTWDDRYFSEVSGTTKTMGVVVRPVDWLSFHYNKSDNFEPEEEAVDLYLQSLPMPTGEGEDYGFSLFLLEEKLIVKVNWFEATRENARSGGDTTTITSRAKRVENEGDWGIVDRITADIEWENQLAPGTLDAWDETSEATQPYIDEIAERSGLSVDYLHNRRGFNDTSTIEAEGIEFSVDYNPTRNWNIKFTATKQKSVESEVAPSTQRWLFGDGSLDDPEPGSRLYIWQNAQVRNEDNTATVNWWTHQWPNMAQTLGSTPEEWYTGVVEAPLRLLTATQGTSRPQIREWRWSLLTNYRFIDGPLDGVGIGGSVRWEDKASIGYYGLENPDTGIIDRYDPSRPIWDDDNYYFDFWASYSRPIFNDRFGFKIQLNVRDAFEDGGLKVIRANPDGSPSVYRIQQPRTFFLTTTLSF